MFGRTKPVSGSDYATVLSNDPARILSAGEMAAGVYVLLARSGTDPKLLKLVTGCSGDEVPYGN